MQSNEMDLERIKCITILKYTVFFENEEYQTIIQYLKKEVSKEMNIDEIESLQDMIKALECSEQFKGLCIYSLGLLITMLRMYFINNESMFDIFKSISKRDINPFDSFEKLRLEQIKEVLRNKDTHFKKRTHQLKELENTTTQLIKRLQSDRTDILNIQSIKYDTVKTNPNKNTNGLEKKLNEVIEIERDYYRQIQQTKSMIELLKEIIEKEKIILC